MFASSVGLLPIAPSPSHHCFQCLTLTSKASDYHLYCSRLKRIAVFGAIFVPIRSRHPDHLEYGKIAIEDVALAHHFSGCKVEYQPHKQVALLGDRPLLSSDLLAA